MHDIKKNLKIANISNIVLFLNFEENKFNNKKYIKK